MDGAADTESDALAQDGGAADGELAIGPSCGRNLVDEPLGVNGAVYAFAFADDGTVFLGGQFSYAGPVTGGAVPLELATGEPRRGFPKVAGTARAIVPDGAGGWYLGGKFTHVGATARGNLAHLLHDGALDPAWAPVANDAVNAIAVDGDRVFVGGKFTTIDGASHTCLASIGRDGRLADWSPSFVMQQTGGQSPPQVHALLVHDGALVVGGFFNGISGEARLSVASFSTGGQLTAWNPSASCIADPWEIGSVLALAEKNGTLYVGGSFVTIGGQSRAGLASFDESWSLTAWNPALGPGGRVQTMVFAGDMLYVGGYFAGVGTELRLNLAAFDAGGALTDWRPVTDRGSVFTYHSQQVHALAVVAGTIYVAGEFGAINGQPRPNLASLDARGNLLPWIPNADGIAYSLAASDGTLYVGGAMKTMCGEKRANLAAIDPSGRLAAWNPHASEGHAVTAMAFAGDTLYAGGDNMPVDDAFAGGLVAVTKSGEVTPWHPAISRWCAVDQILFHHGVLYVAGTFHDVNDAIRDGLAALDGAGQVLPWTLRRPAGSLSDPRALAVLGDTVFIAREGVEAVTTDGTPVPLTSAKTDRYAYALAAGADGVYVGGGFSLVGSEPRNGACSLGSDGRLLAWNPNVTLEDHAAEVYGLAVSGSGVYLAGRFDAVSGEPRGNLAAVGEDGALRAWRQDTNGSIDAVATHDGEVFVGGRFTHIGQDVAAGFARVPASP